jgi:hypothetical protein
MAKASAEPRLRLSMAHLPKDLLAAIGEVTVAWGYVQNLVEVAIWGMKAQTPKVGHAVTAPLSYRRKMAMFRSVGKKFLDGKPAVAAEFSALADGIDDCYKKRNDIEHATWSHFGPHEGPSVSVRALRDGSINPMFQRASDVESVAQEIIRLVMKVDAFCLRHIPPPATPRAQRAGASNAT